VAPIERFFGLSFSGWDDEYEDGLGPPLQLLPGMRNVKRPKIAGTKVALLSLVNPGH
jgi:hypothetical protein